jgi:diacylglycerol O-acyltransferase / wax synthase
VARLVPPLFKLIVSNGPGPPIPLYLTGARVTHIFPMGPLLEGSGLDITLLSQGDMLDIGVMACPALVEDPARFGAWFIDGVRELAALADDLEEAAPTPAG